MILLLLCVFGLSSGLPQLGIVGGNVTDIRLVPYQAAALREPDSDFFCGAAIISKHHLLLAAHCCVGNTEIFFRVGSNYSTEGGTVLRSRRLFIHPKFSFFDYYPVYDACIAEVRRIKYGPSVRPLKIAKRAPMAGVTVRVAGWGQTEKEVVSDVLRSVTIPVTNATYCENAYPGLTDIHMYVCAGSDGKSSCYGDSGGALQWRNSLVGIVSFGRNCGEKGYPGVYTNVNFPEIRKFIRDVAGV